MLTRDFPTTPAVCVLKTSKNVHPSMKVPVWNTIRHGEQMPADKAAVREVSVSKLTSSRELDAFYRSVMFGRSGAVLYSVAPGAPKASFIERPEMLRDQLGMVSVSRKNVSQCDNELGERLLGLNAIIDKASVTLEDLRMENTVLMGHAYAARTVLDSCIVDGFATVVGGKHKDLHVSGESVVVCDVTTRNTSLYGQVVVGGSNGSQMLSSYHLAADGSVIHSFTGADGSMNPSDFGIDGRRWVRTVTHANRGGASWRLSTFCLNSALHRKKSEENCKCGLVLPLALAGHPVAISYLLNRAGLHENVPTEYQSMSEEQMLEALEGCVLFPFNDVLSYRDRSVEGSERVRFNIGSREDWYQHLRDVYGVENPQEIHKFHR